MGGGGHSKRVVPKKRKNRPMKHLKGGKKVNWSGERVTLENKSASGSGTTHAVLNCRSAGKNLQKGVGKVKKTLTKKEIDSKTIIMRGFTASGRGAALQNVGNTPSWVNENKAGVRCEQSASM